ncbi:hypothetical protein FHX63_003635 [Cupriavidus plantarum]|nr:hypothetical protein [Cupriavidus plantarum]
MLHRNVCKYSVCDISTEVFFYMRQTQQRTPRGALLGAFAQRRMMLSCCKVAYAALKPLLHCGQFIRSANKPIE